MIYFLMGKSKTSRYYAENPEAAEKHTKERRRRGIDGKGGKDVSKKKNGKFVLEHPYRNRARNGADGKSTKK